MSLEEKISQLPQKPGIYQFFNSDDKIIYVGKAIKLKNRVKSYFQSNRPKDAKTKALVKNIINVEYIVTDSESEALILEDTLIKEHKPKYNINLRDDKTYPYIKITKEKYPRIFTTRSKIKDGSKYIGPITEVYNLKNLMKTVYSLFRIRTCDLDITDNSIEQKKHKTCLEFHIQRCDGPCEGLISEELYAENVKKSISIFTGKTKEIEKYFEEEMYKFSAELKFEKANFFKNKLHIIREFSSKQKMVSNDDADKDIFGIFRQDEDACTVVLKVRDGKLIGRRNYIIKNCELDSDSDLLQRTIERWYIESSFVPEELIIAELPSDLEYLTGWLGELREKTVRFTIPKMGEKRELVDMANMNAKFSLKEYLLAHQKREQIIPRAVLSLQRDLRMTKVPKIIECFDNSHLQGTDLVSSMVHFEDGKPKKSQYKKFKNKTVLKNDDFASMKEAVLRRYRLLLNEIEEYNQNPQPDIYIPKLPDLVIIDGGKGQLSAAIEALEELGIYEKFVICGLAKRLEELFFPNQKDSLLLPKTSSSLRLLQQIRDEAHRFAITYHRSLRDKRTFTTELTSVKGIGALSAKKLLKELGSVENIKNASEEQLKNYLNKNQIISLKSYFGE